MSAVAQPNQAWVGDITYIWTAEGWLYLATVIDLFSRRVVGWSMSNRMTVDLVNDAILAAILHRKPGEGLIWHTDRGSQYASHSHRKLLKGHGITQSMSRKGNCWDTQFTILMTSHRSDPCWDWLICLRIDLSTGVGVPECYWAQRL